MLAKGGLIIDVALHPADMIAALCSNSDVNAALVVALDHHDIVESFAFDGWHELT